MVLENTHRAVIGQALPYVLRGPKRGLRVVLAVGMVLLLLGGCSNHYVTRYGPPQRQLSCDTLLQEIYTAQQNKEVARADDRFRLRYMLIVPAMLTVYHILQAEKAADQHIEAMQRLFVQQGCPQQGYKLRSP